MRLDDSCDTDRLCERFWQRVMRTEDDGCWLWQQPAPHQYGAIGAKRRATGRWVTVRTHRLAWALAHGEVPDDLDVLHHCDVRACVRPDHLFLGTQQDNMADMDRKGRRVLPPADKVTPAEVIAIREAYATGDVSQKELGRQYALDQSTICDIVRGISWPGAGGPTVAVGTGRTPRTARPKLTVAEAVEMRERYAEGGMSLEALGEIYELSPNTIGDIVTGRTWKRAGGPITINRTGHLLPRKPRQ